MFVCFVLFCLFAVCISATGSYRGFLYPEQETESVGQWKKTAVYSSSVLEHQFSFKLNIKFSFKTCRGKKKIKVLITKIKKIISY